MAMNDLSPADLAAVVSGSRDGGGFGDGNDAWLLLVLIALFGGFGNGGWGGNGGHGGTGSVGGNELYPWLSQQQNVNDGFRDQMLNGGITGIQQSVTTGFSGVQQALCSGFAGVNAGIANGFAQAEIAANGRQMADMNQNFAMQTAVLQGFNGAQAQTAQLGYDMGLGMANQTATILAEHCSDRQALSDATRDIIASNTAQTQTIMDKLCQLELDGVKNQLAQSERENTNLQNQLNMANLAASQAAQTATFQQGMNNEVDALYNRLKNCPVPSMPVYGMQPIFTCPQNQYPGCNCGLNG